MSVIHLFRPSTLIKAASAGSCSPTDPDAGRHGLMRSTGQSNPLTPTKNTPKRRLASQSGIADGFGLSKKGSVLRKICIVPLYGWVFLTRIRSGYQVALEPVVHLALQNHCYCHL